MEAMLRRGEVPTSGENFLILELLEKTPQKYVKLMTELYVCDNLNQIYSFVSFLTEQFFLEDFEEDFKKKEKDFKGKSFRNVIDNKLISFVHL